MKKIEAVFRLSHLERATADLRRRGVEGITISHVKGIGNEKAPTIYYRGTERVVEGVTKVKLETIVPDEVASGIVDALYENTHTGEVGDGIISVTNLERIVRIRTGETVCCEEAYA